ncbi:type I-G CRISPR-associated protein Csb2 [Steroidobacter gossypii]|nr:type I-U CRISPR-associated protein Csb2 [Steroidobacter gossypii]
MSRVLSINVHFHDGRYHGASDGASDWPPSPGRLFQALVAGVARGSKLSAEAEAALKWLEKQPPPTITAPIARQARKFISYVPNNDLDTKAGDPARIDAIRVGKVIHPRLFDSSIPLGYYWSLAEDEAVTALAASVCRVADTLYQLGRGVDMAWACSEVISTTEAERRLSAFPGAVYRPSAQGRGEGLACPAPGTLESLNARYEAFRSRLRQVGVGRRGQQVFSQPPKARFQQVHYAAGAALHLYDLIAPWPLIGSAELVQRVRDIAFGRLAGVFPHRVSDIERLLIGRGASAADKQARVKILPLPSIGHPHADRVIRRILIEIPPSCPIRSEDVDWAFSGLVFESHQTSNNLSNGLIRSSEQKMLAHYGIGEQGEARLWRTVTAAVLPPRVTAHEDDSPRAGSRRKSGSDRQHMVSRASGAVVQALGHAGLRGRVLSVRVQREPFDMKGALAQSFATGTRFPQDRVSHVQIEFAEPVSGPLIIGDGRYLGLGLMAPAIGAGLARLAYCFQIIEGLKEGADPSVCARALRRAVMARAQAEIGSRKTLPMFFTGHEEDGSPARSGNHAHLAFVADIGRGRLWIVTPHALEQRDPLLGERANLKILDRAVQDLQDLRAGSAGRLRLVPCGLDLSEHPVFARSLTWESVTDYAPTRYAKRLSPQDGIAVDVRLELRRLQLPPPMNVEVTDMREGPRGGLSARLRLRFNTAVGGPILIGRTRHSGGGLFAPANE